MFICLFVYLFICLFVYLCICSFIYLFVCLFIDLLINYSTGEENTHDVEHRVQEVHLTSTKQLEDHLRGTSTSAVLHEDAEEVRKYMKMEHDLQASADKIAALSKQLSTLQGQFRLF